MSSPDQAPVGSELALSQELSSGLFVARRINDRLQWGEGPIGPSQEQGFDTPGSELALVADALKSIRAVSPAERGTSLCTDGRRRDKLENGEPVPVRPELAGCDLGSGYYMYESLGLTPRRPAVDRLRWAGEELADMGRQPSAHLGCAACAEYVQVGANTVRFAANRSVRLRQREILPVGVYDSPTQAALARENRERFADPGRYEGLSLQSFIDVAADLSGPRAVASYVNDNRGVKGHVEEGILHLDTPGYALDSNMLAERVGGRQLFGQNQDEMHIIAAGVAEKYGSSYYRPAYLSLQNFADGTHGTIAHDIPTYLVTMVDSSRDRQPN